MKRFFKLFGLGTASLGLLYKPAWRAFSIDESAEGINLEHIPDSVQKEMSDMAIFSVTKERELANDIALNFNTTLAKLQISQNGPGEETLINVMQSIRSKRIYLICSFDTTRWSFNETLIDLFLTISAMKRSSPVEVNVVLPYYAYARQNTMLGPHRKSVFSADIANLLEAAGADRVVTVNLHASQIHGSFTIPILDVDASGLCASYFKKYQFKDLVLVCTNERLFSQAIKIQELFKQAGHKADIGILVEQPHEGGKFNYIGKNIQGRDVLMIDNIIDTGTTLDDATRCVSGLGAKDIYMFAVHGIFSDGAVDKINNSHLKEVVVTNTLPLNMLKLSPKINQVSIGTMLAETIAQATFNLKLDKLKSQPQIISSTK